MAGRYAKKRSSHGDPQEAAEEPKKATARAKSAAKLKYTKPLILAVDLAADDVQVIKDAGFNILSGTFGKPVKVEKSTRFRHVPHTAKLPRVTEQEIVIVDLADQDPGDDDLPDQTPLTGTAIWQSLASGVLDPRARSARAWRDEFDRIYHQGEGVFIVFSERVIKPEYHIGEAHGGFYDRGEWEASNWDFLSIFGSFGFRTDWGLEISLTGSHVSPISEALVEKGAHFDCTLDPWGSKDRWIEFAHNKYEHAVAGALVPRKDSTEGFVFVFPQVPNKGDLVKRMLEDFLPRIHSRLFPEDERRAWLKTDEYALPGVPELRRQIRELEAGAKARVDEIKEKIEAKKSEYGYLNRLLTEQDHPLVLAVKQTLEFIGFADVRDVDEEEGEETERRREDLQIWDTSPIVLIEVKGVGGLGKEAEQLQVTKYIHPRMKQWERLDVHGLAVINHQMGLPPLQRDNENVFHRDVINTATGQDTGLLTTWDLYRLARSYTKLGWQHEDVRDLFLVTMGRVEPIPAHYEQVGHIDGFFEKAAAVVIQLIDGKRLAKGDRIAYELPIEFEEEDVTSIQLDSEPVEEAEGSRIGVKTSLTKQLAKKRTRVFLVSSSDS